ncbi:hypothetical protein [Solicola sp. PLA-1-18]|uniref:hypothetical protein n=1 Tax=Solicola sp. PLA-1-18 TaxID=3380532 RepID=UPI003B785F5B
MPSRPTPLPEPLRARPFTSADVRAQGLSWRVLNGHEVRRLHRGVYVHIALELTLGVEVDAALLALPEGAVASHDTAALLLDLPLPRGAGRELHFWVPRASTGRSVPGVVLHTSPTRPPTTVVGGRTVTAPGKTFIDMATRLGLDDLVALGDGIVRRTGVLPMELQRLAREPRRRWIRRARQAARLVRAGVDSAPKTHLRLAVLDDFLPEPETGADVFDDAGGWIARPDLSWSRWKVAVEYDGEHHRADVRQYNLDIGRREALEDAGWIVVVVTAERLYRRRPQTVTRIRSALQSRGAPIF